VRMELSSTRTELPAMRTVADDTRSEDRPHLSLKNQTSKAIEGGADGTVPALDNEALDEFEEGTI